MEQRKKEEQSRAGISFLFFFSFVAFFFQKLQFGVRTYFTMVKSMNFPLLATHPAEGGQGSSTGGLRMVLGSGAWTALPLPLGASLCSFCP